MDGGDESFGLRVCILRCVNVSKVLHRYSKQGTSDAWADLEAATAVPEIRNPFDVLAEGLLSRIVGPTGFEPATS